MAFGLQTYDDRARREDLLDLISDVSPDDNPLSTMLSVNEAKQTTHEWLEDYIARPTANTGEVEGSDATFSDLTQPSRRTNVTQMIRETFRVSDTERAVNVAGMSDPFDYQRDKALRRWKNRLEFSLLRSALSSGASGSAQTMAGIEATVTSHFTARLSGTSLSEAEINGMQLEVANDVGTGDVFDMILTTLQLRQKISTFTAGNTRYIDASDRKLVRKVMVYEGDFGPMRIFGHKDVSVSAATPGPRVLGLNESKWRISYLTGRRPKYVPLAKTGSATKGMIEGEATLEYLAERANAQRTGYAYTG
jgi:hypothetical protein